jgi:hypothetical protein
MAGDKRSSEEKCEPSRKYTATDLEMKIRMIRKYECEQSLSATACELGFVVSTVNTVLKMLLP